MERPVHIGFMRLTREPTRRARATAYAAHMLGAELIYFNTPSVDLVASTVDGWRYDRDAGWMRCVRPLPDVIVNDMASLKSQPRLCRRLAERLPLTSPPIGNKAQIDRRIVRRNFFPSLRIPTINLESFDDLLPFLAEHEKIVIKPLNGSKGEGICGIERRGAGFAVNAGEGWVELDEAGVRTLYERLTKDTPYVAQRFINSTTKGGIPFDIRLHVQRGRGGEWTIVDAFPRLGAGVAITSNVSAGGSVGLLRPFLNAQYGPERGAEVRRTIRRLGRRMPVEFQKLYRDRVLDALGFDLALDRDGKPWLFEVNDFPGCNHFEIDAAIPRVEYAIHLAQEARAKPAEAPPAPTEAAGAENLQSVG